MATKSKSKTALKRTKVKELPKPAKKLTGKDMKKVKGGTEWITNSSKKTGPGRI